MSDEPQPEPAPKKPRKPKRRPKPRAPKAVEAQRKPIDWYAVGLIVLAIFTFAPYVLPFLKDVKVPEVSVDFSESAGNVATWFADVASDDPKADAPKYVLSLRETADSEISNVAKIDETLRERVEANLGKTGWLDWGLFNISLLKEMRRLREAKILDDSVKSHKQFLEAIADALEKEAK
jgi:hypothetical protein